MLSLAKYIAKPCLIFTILFYFANGFGESSGEKTMNLRLGFDLTEGENGAPSLRIRDFEDSSETKPRAVEDVAVNPKKSPLVRADSFSDSSETGFTNNAPTRADESSKEDRSNRNSEEESEDSDLDMTNRWSTKGLNPGEYEPEENPSVHPKYQDSSDTDSDRPHRRGKRSIIPQG